jgi:hypothetical protein
VRWSRTSAPPAPWKSLAAVDAARLSVHVRPVAPETNFRIARSTPDFASAVADDRSGGGQLEQG